MLDISRIGLWRLWNAIVCPLICDLYLCVFCYLAVQKTKQRVDHFHAHEWEHKQITVHEKHKTVRTIPKRS